jgi:hypothetical protein
VGSGIAAAIIPDPKSPPSLALNSPWIFRGETFVIIPLAAYIIWILVESIFKRELVLKLGLGPLQVERAKAELAKGGLALEAARQAVPSAAVDETTYREAMRRFRASLDALDGMVGDRQ